MSGLTRHGRLKFNTADIDGNCSDNIGVYLRDGYGLQLTSTEVDVDTQALDVFLHGFDQTISNEDGYLYVDLVDDLLSDDGYVNVNIASSDIQIDVDVDISQYAEDSAHITGDLGDFNLSVRLDDLTVDNSALLADTNGDYQGFFTNELGELYVHDEDAYGKLCEIVTGLDTINFDPSIVNEDGYLHVDVGTITVNTALETEIQDCALPDGYAGSQSFIADSYRRLWVNNASAIAGKTQTVTATDTASLLMASELPGRTRILVQNLGDAELYLGFDGTVTADDAATGGFLLSCNDSMALEISDCVKLYAITESGETAKVKVLETA